MPGHQKLNQGLTLSPPVKSEYWLLERNCGTKSLQQFESASVGSGIISSIFFLKRFTIILLWHVSSFTCSYLTWNVSSTSRVFCIVWWVCFGPYVVITKGEDACYFDAESNLIVCMKLMYIDFILWNWIDVLGVFTIHWGQMGISQDLHAALFGADIFLHAR